MDSLKQINDNREDYNYVDSSDLWISKIFNAFGQNSHALADFYAHSNWVDAQSRGGYFEEKLSKTKTKCGFVPIGLNRTELWDEKSYLDELYSGTVATKTKDGYNSYICNSPVTGDVTCSNDMTTHGYWAKDEAGELGGGQTYDFKVTEQFAKEGKYFGRCRNTTLKILLKIKRKIHSYSVRTGMATMVKHKAVL